MQSIANTAWSLANLSILDRPLLDAISRAAIPPLPPGFMTSNYSRSELLALAMGLLGIIWARAFLEVEDMMLSLSVRKALCTIGAELHTRTSTILHLPRVAKRLAVSVEPSLSLILRGVAVVLKPPDWEVDGRAGAFT